MKRILCFFVLANLGISMRGLSQAKNAIHLKGDWHSVNRPDTLTMKFKDDSIVYFETKAAAPFIGKPFSYIVYSLQEQPLIELTAPGNNFHMKLLLWVISPDEIKLQSVDLQDYGNPLQHIPAETDKNTFWLKRIG